MHSSTGDKIAKELGLLREAVQELVVILRGNDLRSKRDLSSEPIKISINESVFDGQHLLRGEKPE